MFFFFFAQEVVLLDQYLFCIDFFFLLEVHYFLFHVSFHLEFSLSIFLSCRMFLTIFCHLIFQSTHSKKCYSAFLYSMYPTFCFKQLHFFNYILFGLTSGLTCPQPFMGLRPGDGAWRLRAPAVSASSRFDGEDGLA